MLTKLAFSAAVLSALGFAGCTSETDGADGGADASAEAAPPEDAGGPIPTPVVTGIAECDDLIARYDACLAKNPELNKKEYMLVKARKSSLQIQASSPEGKETTGNRCRVLFEGPLKSNCPR